MSSSKLTKYGKKNTVLRKAEYDKIKTLLTDYPVNQTTSKLTKRSAGTLKKIKETDSYEDYQHKHQPVNSGYVPSTRTHKTKEPQEGQGVLIVDNSTEAILSRIEETQAKIEIRLTAIKNRLDNTPVKSKGLFR